MTNENDDWEIAVDTGEFDKRLERDRTTAQESIPFTVNDNDDYGNSSKMNLLISNKPIRILKRPTSQSQLPVHNDTTQISNSPFPIEIPSSTIVPSVSIIPRNQTKDSIKTYEQREQEYRLARLRIMGEEESSAKDDDDDDDADDHHPTINSIPINSDETSKITQSSLQNQVNYPNNTIHFTPNGPFSQQPYRAVYTPSYPPMPLPGYPPAGLYIPPSNPWYPYLQQQTPYGTQQYSHQPQ